MMKADLLSTLFAAQENWRRAEAVQDGRQPAIDPDRHALLEFSDDLRVYATLERCEPIGGRELLTRHHVTKRLVDGEWVREEVADALQTFAARRAGPEA